MRTRNASFRVCCKFFFAAAHARLLLSVPAPAPHCCARVSAAQMCGRTSAPDAIAGAHNARLRSCAAKLALAPAPAQSSLQLCAQMGSVQYGVWGLLLRALQRSSASAHSLAQPSLAWRISPAWHIHTLTQVLARDPHFLFIHNSINGLLVTPVPGGTTSQLQTTTELGVIRFTVTGPIVTLFF